MIHYGLAAGLSMVDIREAAPGLILDLYGAEIDLQMSLRGFRKKKGGGED